MPKDISSSSEDEAGSPPAKSALKQKESGGGVSSAPTAQKPNRFQCPADFVSFCHKPCSSTLTESLKNNKNELWLIKAPASFNPECFSGIKVPLSGLQTLKVPAAAGGVKTGSGQQIYSVLASTHVTSELCLLTSEEESSSGVVFGPTFSGLLNVCESYGDSSANQAPQVIPADPAPSIPPGLKQRFHPFGSKTPTLTCVAETQTDGASSATPRSLPGKRLIGETKQGDEDEEEGRKKKKKKKKEKRIKTEQGEESTEEVRVKEEPVTEIEDQAMVEEGDVLEEKRKKKKKKKDREREEVEEGVENCVKMEEVTVKSEPTDTLDGDVAEDSAKKKKKKKKKSKTDDD